jgi:putative oxidoreductase
MLILDLIRLFRHIRTCEIAAAAVLHGGAAAQKDVPMSNSASIAAPFSGRATAANLDGIVPLAGRLLMVGLFLLSGLSKVSAPSGTIGYIQSAGLPFPTLGFALAVLVEIGGSIALLLGYRTRLVAAIMAVFTIATAIAFHNALGDQNQFIHFFKNVSIAGGFLQIIAFGGGRYSIDARRS